MITFTFVRREVHNSDLLVLVKLINYFLPVPCGHFSNAVLTSWTSKKRLGVRRFEFQFLPYSNHITLGKEI